MALLTLLSGVGVLAGIAWLVRCRTAAAICGVFLLFSLAWRMIAVMYIDLFGPVYAEELEREVGGGTSAPLFAVTIGLLLVFMAWFFRPGARILRGPQPPLLPRRRLVVTLADVAFLVCAIFLALLYADMLRRGVIPLFAGMDRSDYVARFAGPLHVALFKYGNLLAIHLGVFFVYGRLREGHFDYRFLGLLAMVLFYWALTGHRFSAFYSYGAFFALPLGALPFARAQGWQLADFPPRNRLEKLLRASWFKWFGAFVFVAMVVLLLANSFINVREYGDLASDKLLQRVLVQPVELWWLTWERLFERGHFDPKWAADMMFFNPVDPARNTGIQFLMVLALGDARALEILDVGSQYAGGFPEVLFELLGPVGALWAALLAAAITAWLMRALVVAICRGHFLSVFWISYVYFAFCLLFIGGMLNFLIVWTFWLKVAGLAVSLVLERRLESIGINVVPWIWFQANAGRLKGPAVADRNVECNES